MATTLPSFSTLWWRR